MSSVTNYVLFLPIDDEPSSPLLAAINARLDKHDAADGFVQVESHAGGPKVFAPCVALLAGNYLPVEDVERAIVAACSELDDYAREQVQLLWRHDSERFEERRIAWK